MATRLNDLKVQINSPQISLLREENAYFLRGEIAEPSLGNLWKGWVPISNVVIVAGILTMLVVGVLLFAEWIWDSPFVTTVDGMIDGVDENNSRLLLYHYEVDGVRYDQRGSSRTFSTGYADGNVPTRVVYLNFDPSRSQLRDNIEAPDLFLIILMLGFISSLPIGAYFGLREHRRLMHTRENATHVIDGVIAFEAPGTVRGVTMHAYAAVSPTTGKPIGGIVQIGRLSAQYGRIGKGANVVILYADDKHHMVM
jgi:hypothetical protein